MAVDDAFTTSLLHFQNRVWTFVNNAQIDTAQKPFATGGSLLLDGTGDYITTPASADWNWGTAPWTVDFWIRPNAIANNVGLFDNSLQANYTKFSLSTADSGAKVLKLRFGGTQYNGSTAITNSTWQHIAVVRNGTSLRTYVGGVVDIDATISAADTWDGSTTAFWIAGYYSVTYCNYNGWMGEFRITKGLARWTADFSATLPNRYTDDADTVSLLHFDEADGAIFTKDVAANWTMDAAPQFYDESGKPWTAAGNAQIDTAQSVFGGSSGLFDGTGDRITAAASANFQFSGDFTIDFWMRQSSQTGLQRWFATRDSDSALLQMFSENGSLQVCGRNITGTLPAAGNWAHIALVRSGTSIKLYIGGTQSGSTWTSSANFNDNYGFFLGQYHTNSGLFGWIDEFRISKGIARWTSNFTPPTAEYTSGIYPLPTIATVDTFNAPTINTMFIPTIATVDTFNAPFFGRAIPIPSFATVDTFNAPTKYIVTYHIPAIFTNDVFNAPTANIPIRRKRVKVNW